MRFRKQTRTGWVNRLLIWSLFLVCAGGVFASATEKASAAPPYDPPGPDRYSVTVVDYTKYFWWLVHWGEDDVECKIETDHEGLPTPGDIYIDCGEDLYDKWIKQKPCLKVNVADCKGFYLHLAGTEPAQKEVSTKFPPATAVTRKTWSYVFLVFATLSLSWF
jgi:hypothetical protein